LPRKKSGKRKEKRPRGRHERRGAQLNPKNIIGYGMYGPKLHGLTAERNFERESPWSETGEKKDLKQGTLPDEKDTAGGTAFLQDDEDPFLNPE